jgi:isoquinoline 1-oxidoreductase beta subunit
MRSVCNTFHAFAVNSFMDELAHTTGRDPLQFHTEMLGRSRILEFSERDRENPYKFDTGRLSRVIEEVAGVSEWGRPVPEGHGLGFAAHYSFMSYTAMVIHASMDAAGMVDVHEVHCAVDCGQVVNPDTVTAQMEGAVALGLSLALHGRVTLEEGVVEQGNFDDYPVVRMNEMPVVHVHIVESDAPPTGIGEPGVPPTAPALCNAIFAATGRRFLDLPISGEDFA